MQIKLEAPSCGWSSLTIEDDHKNSFRGAISYITDAANDILNAACVFLTTGVETAILFDEEGSEWTLIIDKEFVKVHSERRKIEGITFFINAKDLIHKLCQDIYENIDDWTRWEYYGDESKEKYIKDRFILKAKINSVLMLLDA